MQALMHNLSAQFANRQLNITTGESSKASEKLSSGYRINRSADDAAGLQISEKMRWQIRGLDKASNNCQDGSAFCKVADGAMNEMHNMVARMKELSVQAANDTNTDADRAAIQEEITQICDELQRISDETEYNTIKVFGKERKKTVTPPGGSTGGVNQVSDQVYSIKGNNYGLAEVIGADHISPSHRLDQPMNYQAGWVTTGKTGFKYTDENRNTTDEDKSVINGKLQGYDAKLTIDYQNLVAGFPKGATTASTPVNGGTGEGKWQSNTFIYTMDNNGKRAEIQLSFLNDTIYSGNIKTYDIDANTGIKKNYTTCSFKPYENREGGAAVPGNTYGSAWIDFSGAGTDFKIEDLYQKGEEGFNSQCATCNKHYSIKFVDDTNSHYVADSNFPRLEVGLQGCTTGAEIVQRIIDAVNDCDQFNDHYTQYAYDPANPSKLYMYDNRTYEIDGGSSVFEPTYRTEDGKMNLIEEKEVHPTPPGTVVTYTDRDLWIQSGAQNLQGIWLKRPWINNSTLGIAGLSVLTADDAQAAISICDKATEIISEERSKMGAYDNRFSHMVSIDDNTSENTQAAESRIRDADIAKVMVAYSKCNILKQAGEAVLAQANQMPRGILDLLQ